MKRCKNCRGVIPETKNKQSLHCSERCAKIQGRKRRYHRIKNNPDRNENLLINAFISTWKKRSGIDVKPILEQIKKLRGLKICEICGKKDQVFCIDHNHKTLKIRGLLCKKCNSAIAYFLEDTRILENAISYLRKYD